MPKDAIEIAISSISEGSRRQYETTWRKWWRFCQENNISFLEGTIPEVLNFLADQFQKGASYGTINSHRSALALILGAEVGQDPRVRRFSKGVANLRPPRPKYDSTWDPKIVLEFLSQWYPNDAISLEQLSFKLVTLLALTTGHRMQTFSLININNIRKGENCIEIKIPARIKTSKPGKNQPTLVLPFYEENVKICAALTLQSYILRTRCLRKNIENLFIATKKPHKAVSAESLSRWVKVVLSKSGIDTDIFTAHSTRHASTSAANRNGVSIDLIRKTAGWSDKSITFAKFYNRRIVKDKGLFAKAILDS